MRKRWIKILIVITGTLIILLIIGVSYIKLALPDVGEAPEISVEITEPRVQRGHYLANNVMVCMQCHSQRDWTKFAAPSIPETMGAGGEIHDQRLSTSYPKRLC